MITPIFSKKKKKLQPAESLLNRLSERHRMSLVMSTIGFLKQKKHFQTPIVKTSSAVFGINSSFLFVQLSSFCHLKQIHFQVFSSRLENAVFSERLRDMSGMRGKISSLFGWQDVCQMQKCMVLNVRL